MATYIVSSALGENKWPDISPQTTTAEILQNVQTIISTVKGTVPLDRGFGIDGAVVDLPIQIAQARLSNEIFQAIKKYEPRVQIQEVTFSTDMSGKLTAKVAITV